MTSKNDPSFLQTDLLPGQVPLPSGAMRMPRNEGLTDLKKRLLEDPRVASVDRARYAELTQDVQTLLDQAVPRPTPAAVELADYALIGRLVQEGVLDGDPTDGRGEQATPDDTDPIGPKRVVPKDDSHLARVQAIADEIKLGMKCEVRVGTKKKTGAVFVQIKCLRVDVITGEEDWGFGGKAEPSEFASDNEIIQMIFGLFLSYWTHEARENFEWCGRRIYGPHMKAEALWTVARKVDLRDASHKTDHEEG